jgi:hypothetical protein
MSNEEAQYQATSKWVGVGLFFRNRQILSGQTGMLAYTGFLHVMAEQTFVKLQCKHRVFSCYPSDQLT